MLHGSDSKPLEYYYLPVNLRLAKRPDGVPEFLFLNYTTDQKADAGGVQGAIMHFLMEWGLTPEQLAKLQAMRAEQAKAAMTKREQMKKTEGAKPAEAKTSAEASKPTEEKKAEAGK